MCESIGVDPLASNKGFWADLLGVGDFYYELGVVIIQITLQTRSTNGGVMMLNELLTRIRSTNVSSRRLVSAEDIKRAVKKLQVLGNGFQLVEVLKRITLQLCLDVPNNLIYPTN